MYLVVDELILKRNGSQPQDKDAIRITIILLVHMGTPKALKD
jgi:hypothetical protein